MLNPIQNIAYIVAFLFFDFYKCRCKAFNSIILCRQNLKPFNNLVRDLYHKVHF